MKTKKCIKTFSFVAGIIILIINITSCQENSNLDKCLDDYRNSSSYDENNFKFTTIDLWGSPAAVVDEGDYYLFQGDIRLDKSDIDSVKTRGAGRMDARWPNNKVYYKFVNVPDDKKSVVYSAINEITEKSYLTFEPAEFTDAYSYISIVYDTSDGFSAYSNYIGRKGGKQEIHLTKAAWEKGYIMHELCHAIGLYHEQCRADRDQYVNIDFSSLDDKGRYQYKTYVELGENGADLGSFDFNSIMLYGSYYNDVKVMTKKDGTEILAQRNIISRGDMYALSKIQPIINFTFYDPAGHNTPVDRPYEYIRSKYLRCPVRTDVTFRFQYKFQVNQSVLNGYSLNDFDIKARIKIIDNHWGFAVYYKEIPVLETSSYKDTYLPLAELFPGFYVVRLQLTGTVKGGPNSAKADVLERLMYAPLVYLHLNDVKIEDQNVPIPNNSSDADIKRSTFIAIV